MLRQLDWVDRLAGVDTIDVDELIDGEWVLYPVGEWVTWPKWRRLVDLSRARIGGTITAAVLAALYRVRYNPRNVWDEDPVDRTVRVPMGEAFRCYQSMYDIHHNYCCACDRPEHVHNPAAALPLGG